MPLLPGEPHPFSVADQPRVEVAALPMSSPFADIVRQVAPAVGAVFVGTDAASPGDLAERVLVVDLTRAMAVEALGPHVIAIHEDQGLDCYEVIRPAAVERRLPRVLRNLVEAMRLRARLRGTRETVSILNEIGMALSAITDRRQLLHQILSHARRLLRADGGTIYLVESGMLHFAAAQNDSVEFVPARTQLPLDEHSLAGFTASRGTSLNIDDIRRIPPQAPYKPDLAFDRAHGYRTRSMILVPMFDREGDVLGVTALVNRKEQRAGVPVVDFESFLPFTEDHLELARSIASQAAVALENHRLYDDIRKLLDGFMTAAVTVIEARDPSTAGHSQRVSKLTIGLAEACDACSQGRLSEIRFDPEELEELRYAALLHDFGKVGVREQVLLKAEKLYPWELETIEWRFRLAAMEAMLESMSAEEMPGYLLGRRLQQMQEDLETIRRVNRPGHRFRRREVDAVRRIAERWFLEEEQQPVLRRGDIERLCVPYGSLDPEERREIQQHVERTYQFLKVIPWTRELARVPDIARAHHEKLDGSGYPRGLVGDQIPLGARIMTVVDIFDALTASDRAYKPAMGLEKALYLLHEEARAGRLDADMVDLFARKRIWKLLKER